MRASIFKWGEEELRILFEMYEDYTALEIGTRIGCSSHVVLRKAGKLKLSKGEDFFKKVRTNNLRQGRDVPSPAELSKAHIPISKKEAQEQGISYVVHSTATGLPPCPTMVELLEQLSGWHVPVRLTRPIHNRAK